MTQVSAGLLMYNNEHKHLRCLLVHPGGPFYKNKNEGVWSIPKGLANSEEELLAAAIREFTEETGIVPQGPYFELGTARLKSGKVIHAWAFSGEWNEAQSITSNTFQLEWPPRSGKFIDVPEADRGEWFNKADALKYINPAQAVFIERLESLILQTTD